MNWLHQKWYIMCRIPCSYGNLLLEIMELNIFKRNLQNICLCCTGSFEEIPKDYKKIYKHRDETTASCALISNSCH